MKSEIKITLQFEGFTILPDELSQQLEIDATESWLRGEPSGRTGIKKKDNAWLLDSGIQPLDGFEKHVTGLFQKIEPHMEKFVEFANECPPVLSCIVRSYDGDRPYMGFESQMVKKLAQLNATIDIDLYIL